MVEYVTDFLQSIAQRWRVFLLWLSIAGWSFLHRIITYWNPRLTFVEQNLFLVSVSNKVIIYNLIHFLWDFFRFTSLCFRLVTCRLGGSTCNLTLKQNIIFKTMIISCVTCLSDICNVLQSVIRTLPAWLFSPFV